MAGVAQFTPGSIAYVKCWPEPGHPNAALLAWAHLPRNGGH